MVAAALGLTGAGGAQDRKGSVLTAAPRSPAPTLSDRPCDLTPDLGIAVDCHWVTVPLNRKHPRGNKIRLAVAVLHSRSRQPEPDPVVFLEGGPGEFVVENLADFAHSPLLDKRDLVLFDQRGTGLSEPNMECPERERLVIRELGRVETYEVAVADERRAWRRCHSRLVAAGVDLDAFDTEASAADLADLRVALGVKEWNLWGVSYGARVELAAMRSHPTGIRSAVLDSVTPPHDRGLRAWVANADRALRALFDDCAADSVCNARYPDLEGTFRSVIEQLNEAPFEATVDLGEPFGLVPFVMDGDDFVELVYDGLADSAMNGSVPLFITLVATGNTALIPAFVPQMIRAELGGAEAVHISVECADLGGPRAGDRALVANPGDKGWLLPAASTIFCDTWPVERLPRAFNRPVRSRIPSLLLAGTYDPVTAPADTKATANALRSATYVEFNGLGHVVSFANDCVIQIRLGFVDDPAAPDVSCAATVQPSFQT